MTDREQVSPSRVQVLDEEGMSRTVARMAAEIVEKDGGGIMLVGIHTRGVPLARRLAAAIAERSGRKVAVGRLDITLYRDDVGPWRPAHSQPIIKDTSLPESIGGEIIYLVDDVLFTGRTVRAVPAETASHRPPGCGELAPTCRRSTPFCSRTNCVSPPTRA